MAPVGTATPEEAGADLGTEIVRFSRVMAAWKHRAKNEPGAAERILLARLVTDGARRATDLAAEAFLDLSTVSRQVRSLVERGLVERRPDPEDRRGYLLTATDAGHETYLEFRRQRDAELGRLLTDWSPEDRYQIIRLMTRLNDDLVDLTHEYLGAGPHSGTAAEQGGKHA
ncbi:MarR family transcriptional regulator [Streptomyces ferralitis]|uniref:MarR family transcriptional regulator n=2 Tax=Streptantibioticus ferralitis TaxID=236510 RepID=A0ABT5Z8Q0_9ACTN|nr:MarR family transcriptional regulator [Streptantibioticus ferralitis]MDF2260098.1 MarR family transcriptional regulator [Streptantibioticus ferralitis]